MKNSLVILAIVATSMLPLQAFADKGYYFKSSSPRDTHSYLTHGPFPTLAACQDALAKMLGKFPDMKSSGCFQG